MNTLSESTYLVLLALYHKPLHGYGIIKGIENISENEFYLAPGTLYGVLKNLQKKGLIKTVYEEENHRKKKIYSITKQGEEVFKLEFNRYQNMIKITKRILGEEG